MNGFVHEMISSSVPNTEALHTHASVQGCARLCIFKHIHPEVSEHSFAGHLQRKSFRSSRGEISCVIIVGIS